MTVFLMSILYLFLCLLQFHADTDDSAVRIEKYSSIAKSILLSILIGSNKGTTFSCSRIFTNPWNLDCTERHWTVGVKEDIYTIKYYTTAWAATAFQLKTQYSSRTCGMSFKKVKSRNYAQVEKI